MEKKTSVNIAVKWAVIYLIASIILTFTFQFLDINQKSPIRYISFIPYVAFLFLAQKEYKDKLGGFLKLGDCFISGLFFALFSGLFSAIFTYIYFSILSPEVWEKTLTTMEEQLLASHKSEDQINTVMDLYKNHGILITSIGVLIIYSIIGAIIALIGAAIFKKERSITDIERDASSYSDPVV